MKKDLNIDALHIIYQELVDLVGEENMLKIYDVYQGTEITVPEHLYSNKKAAKRVVEEFNGHNQQELARKYGYSQKWVRSKLNNPEITK